MLADVRGYFRGSENTLDYELAIEEARCRLRIKIGDYSKRRALKVFDSLVQFLRYSYFNSYLIEELGDKLVIDYYTASRAEGSVLHGTYFYIIIEDKGHEGHMSYV